MLCFSSGPRLSYDERVRRELVVNKWVPVDYFSAVRIVGGIFISEKSSIGRKSASSEKTKVPAYTWFLSLFS